MSQAPDPNALAAGKRQARAQRIHDMRVRIAAIAVALFVAAWAGLYVQLVSGHDPALAGTRTPVTQSADPDATTEDDGWSDDETGDGWSDDVSGDGWSDDGSSSAVTQGPSTAEPAPVTSGQS